MTEEIANGALQTPDEPPKWIARFAQSMRSAVDEKIRDLGGEEFLALPQQGRVERLRLEMIGDYALSERGFIKEVFHRRPAAHLSSGAKNQFAEKFADILFDQWQEWAKKNPGHAAPYQNGGRDVGYFRTLISSNRANGWGYLRLRENTRRFLAQTLWIPLIRSMPEDERRRCKEFLETLLDATYRGNMFGTRLNALIREYRLEMSDIIRHQASDRNRLARIEMISSRTLEDYICFRHIPSLQSLHAVMLGLENAGVPRKALASFCEGLGIPYNAATGCVLPSMREVMNDFRERAKNGAATDHVQLLRTLRNARDVNQSRSAMREYPAMQSYAQFEFCNTHKGKRRQTAIGPHEADSIVRLLKYFAGKNGAEFNGDDELFLLAALKYAKFHAPPRREPRWNYAASHTMFFEMPNFPAADVPAEPQRPMEQPGTTNAAARPVVAPP